LGDLDHFVVAMCANDHSERTPCARMLASVIGGPR
jgi:hypothetical protein